MSTSDRKKLIMEHLSLTSNINFKSRSQSFKPEPSPIRETIPITPQSRKKAIMEHLTRSSGNFNGLSVNSQQRKQKIQEHIRLSKS